ncbi:hypothetical protein [Streptomyces sp. NPDC007369]|uniref:hypothetical protein n=1 Tax=Streptomyces sp. NPDC007369 TaxID=3154589 RepID=UPI003410C566
MTNSVSQEGQTCWTGLRCRLVSLQVGEQKTWRLVWVATLKTDSQTGQRPAISDSTSVTGG